MKDDKITLKESVRAIPRLTDMLVWGFVGYCIVAGIAVMATLMLTFFSMVLLPETTETAIMAFGEWAKTNSTIFGVVFATIFFVGLALFVRKITIGVAKDL